MLKALVDEEKKCYGPYLALVKQTSEQKRLSCRIKLAFYAVNTW